LAVVGSETNGDAGIVETDVIHAGISEDLGAAIGASKVDQKWSI
jgi:hypothetical protein